MDTYFLSNSFGDINNYEVNGHEMVSCLHSSFANICYRVIGSGYVCSGCIMGCQQYQLFMLVVF